MTIKTKEMASLAFVALLALKMAPMAEAQVYAYEEDYDRSYPGAGKV